MIKKTIFAVFIFAISVQAALGDWHHHHSHEHSLPNPSADSFFVTGIIIILSSVALLFIMGPILIIRACKIRNILWIIPTANLFLYLLSISSRPYPGGFLARFAPPGLEYTILEVLLLLLLSFCVVLILAGIHWIRSKFRPSKANDKKNDEGER